VEKEPIAEVVNFDDTPTKLMNNSAALRNFKILKPLTIGSEGYYEQAENDLTSGNNINFIINY
jgi:hypothetical protein